MLEVLRTLVEIYGDAQLPSGSDPFSVQSRTRASIHLQSNLREHQHLTYDIMLAAVRGLRNVLINEHNYHEASFDIYEAGIGQVGSGILAGSEL